MSNSEILSTSEIVSKIKSSYKRIKLDKLDTKDNFFGIVSDEFFFTIDARPLNRPSILEEQGFINTKKYQEFIVKGLNQILDILKELNVLKDNSKLFIGSNLRSQVENYETAELILRITYE